MRSRLWITIVLMISLAILSLAALGIKLIRDERLVLRTQFVELHAARLRDYRDSIDSMLQSRAQKLTQVLEKCAVDGRQALSSCSSSFFTQTAQYTSTGTPMTSKIVLPATQQIATWIKNSQEQFHSDSPVTKWESYYSENGLGLVLLSSSKQPSGYQIFAAEISRARLFAALIAELPDASEAARMIPGTQVVLIDEHGDTLHSWGSISGDTVVESVTMPLKSPLQSMHLRYLAPKSLWDRPFYSSALFIVFPGVLVIILLLIILTAYFYRQHIDEIRETSQRVTFVNQISHEFKTPLTNIRMYAELLERRLQGEDQTAEGFLSVIVSESQRLSRLITSILNFSLHEKKKLEFHPRHGDILACVYEAVLPFRPRLIDKGFTIEINQSNGPSQNVMFDNDVLQQILGNLIGNVEKYSTSGRYLGISCEQSGDFHRLVVSDHGPGIAIADRERVFDAFYRGSSATKGGNSGAGIGLHIARELARLHGGDLRLLETPIGATFELILYTRTIDESVAQEVSNLC